MSRALLVLSSQAIREKAARWVSIAPDGVRLEFKRPRRSLEQNSKMWAMLTEISEQLDWRGQRYTPEDWKDYLMHALRKARWMPDEDGGMVPIGMRTSDLSKDEMGDLIELMTEFGARHGVNFETFQ
jgi:hypothetical protein